MPFHYSSLTLAALFAALACTAGWLTTRYPTLWRDLPRHRVAGLILGLICLSWAAQQVNLMLEIDVTREFHQLLDGDLLRFRLLVLLAVPVIAIAAYYHLDFIFTRALGGFLLLILTDMLHQAFAIHLPARGAFSLFCYLAALVAMFIVAVPWHFRDFLKRTHDSRAWRHGAVLTLATGALVVCGFGLASCL